MLLVLIPLGCKQRPNHPEVEATITTTVVVDGRSMEITVKSANEYTAYQSIKFLLERIEADKTEALPSI